MEDRIFIEQLQVFTCIGIYEWEQKIKQKLTFDIEMVWDTQLASQTDDIKYCLNYVEVCECITHFLQDRAFLLIETVANKVAELLLQTFNLHWIKIKLSKPNAIAQADNVGVIIVRTC